MSNLSNGVSNRMLLNGSSLSNGKKRPSVGKIEELAEPPPTTSDSQPTVNMATNKLGNSDASIDDRKQRRSSDLLKAKNYLKAQLKLQESRTVQEEANGNENSNQSIAKPRSNSFLLGKNSAEFNNLLVSFDSGNGGVPKNDTFRQQHQQATLKASLVASTQASLARHVNKKTSNENLKSSISRIARQKSGEHLKATSMNEKQMSREISNNKKEELPSPSQYQTSSSSSSSACGCSNQGATSATTPTPTPPPATSQSQIPSFQDSSNSVSNRKELLLIPSDKLAEYISRSIGKVKTDETNSIVDQMASFIDELKDFIDDRLIDTTSQLEMSNRHIYHLYKSVNYLIKEVSSLKIQNEELKQELFILNSRLKSKPLVQQSQTQSNLLTHVTPICCYANLKNSGANKSTSLPKNNDYLLVESSPSDERDLSRLSELSGGDTSNEATTGRSFFEGFYNEDETRNLNYHNWKVHKQTLNPTTTGVNITTSQSNPYFGSAAGVVAVESASSDLDANSGSSPNKISADHFISTDDNLDKMKLTKLLNCEIEYFKSNSVKSAGVSPRKTSNEGLKLIDQLLASKSIDKRVSMDVSHETVNGASKNIDNAANKKAREVLSKSSIIHHLHTSLAPFNNLINDFDAQYLWDYTDNQNI